MASSANAVAIKSPANGLVVASQLAAAVLNEGRAKSDKIVVTAAVDAAATDVTAVVGGTSHSGDVSIALALGASAPLGAINVSSARPLLDAVVAGLASGAGAEVLNVHLMLRTFVVGYELSMADVIAWAYTVHEPSSEHFPYLARWYAMIGSLDGFKGFLKVKKAALEGAGGKAAGKAPKAVKGEDTRPVGERIADLEGQLAKLSPDDPANKSAIRAIMGQLSTLQKVAARAAANATAAAPPAAATATATDGAAGASTDGGGDAVYADLPGAVQGGVHTRFPPEPSGFLHIGHAKAAMLNNFYARKYGGTLRLRFDDTNPAKEKAEFVENIIRDLKTLNIVPDTISYTSDHFQLCIDKATALLRNGRAYVDSTPVDQMREERGKCIESKDRGLGVEENLRRWAEMQLGSTEGCTFAMRVKMDMASDNGTLRDPVIFRCNLNEHHRTGAAFKVYPTYDFACPIVDSHEGVTHPLRSNEYRLRNEQYRWMCEILEMRLPAVQDFSRLNFSYTCLSKRKLQWFVESGIVSGWDDPRFPTVQGIMRRGLTVEALWEFIALQGASQKGNLHDWDKIWAINKKHIDGVVPRHTAIPTGSRVLLTLTDAPEEEIVSVAAHKKNPAVGTKFSVRSREVWVELDDAQLCAVGEELTLMDWGNAVVDAIHRDAAGAITGMTGHLNLAGDFKATEKKLTWLPRADEHLVAVTLVEFDHLITVASLEKDDSVEDCVRPNSRVETAAVADANIKHLKKGDRLQFMRRGYFIVDEPWRGTAAPMVAFFIPDGHKSKASILGSKQ